MTSGKQDPPATPKRYTTISIDTETRMALERVRHAIERKLTQDAKQPIRLSVIGTLKELMRAYRDRAKSA